MENVLLNGVYGVSESVSGGTFKRCPTLRVTFFSLYNSHAVHNVKVCRQKKIMLCVLLSVSIRYLRRFTSVMYFHRSDFGKLNRKFNGLHFFLNTSFRLFYDDQISNTYKCKHFKIVFDLSGK